MQNKMAEKLEEPFKEPSVERLRTAVEELKKAAMEEKPKKTSPPKEIKDFQGGKQEKDSNPQTESPPSATGIADRSTIQKEEKITPELKIAEIRAELPDLTQERIKLEKVYQELKVLKEKVSQRIELLKTLERRKKEIDKQSEDFHQQLANFKKENADFLNQIKNKLEKENDPSTGSGLRL